MNEIKVFCGGKEYDLGYAHGRYYRPPFRPVITSENPIAYVVGYLAGTNDRLGDCWQTSIDGDIRIDRLQDTSEVTNKESKQTLWLIDIECGSDQRVDAYILDDSRGIVVVASCESIVGIPAGIWRISITADSQSKWPPNLLKSARELVAVMR